MNDADKHIGQWVRSTHPYSFRSGEWAQIKQYGVIRPAGLEPRGVWLVEFEDGTTDMWAVNDSQAGYEFRA